MRNISVPAKRDNIERKNFISGRENICMYIYSKFWNMKMENIPWKKNIIYRENNMEDMHEIWKLVNNKGKIQCEGYL